MTDHLAWYVTALRQKEAVQRSMLTARPQRAKDKGGRHPWNAFRQGGLPHGWFQTQGRRPHVTSPTPTHELVGRAQQGFDGPRDELHPRDGLHSRSLTIRPQSKRSVLIAPPQSSPPRRGSWHERGPLSAERGQNIWNPDLERLEH